MSDCCNVLFIGNKGSFLAEIKKTSKKLSFECCYHEILPGSGISSFDNVDWNSFSTVVYLGGETRFSGRMELLNFDVPKNIFDNCVEYGCDFVYLSSLSVFGNSYDDKITFDSCRNPIDNYGRTKLKMDQYVDGKLKRGISVSRIYPASIHSGKGRSSLEKVEHLYSRFPLLKCIKFPGCISFISRKDLIDIVYSAIENPVYEIMASEAFYLKRLSINISLPIPMAPMGFFKFISILCGEKFGFYARMIFRGVLYK